MRKFLLLGLGAFAFFSSACNDDVSLATSDVVVDSSSSVVPVPVEESSSSVMDISSESDVSSSSSLVETESSSSSEDVSSSSRRVVDYFFGWEECSGGQVNTGSPEETSGYWYDFYDHNEGGSSRFIFPPDIERNEGEDFFGLLADAYGGIKASVVLGEGSDYPYAGFGFNIWSENQEGVNVEAWLGICVAYQSTIDFVIELGVENEPVSSYSNYRVTVPESKFWTHTDFPWSAFGPYPGIYEVLRNVATIRLKFEGPAGTTGDFRIQHIGSLGQCSTTL
ncbi:hypothetical protein SAMN05720761_12736 [Fibrobacter sp. UWCM]|uniref:hypothetical protein n=1 Tax=Fibrobacter sp. UWCM TaxID=1896208 RepID=UPI000911BE55|nr:hypothetical protein [Fibrobacter sp. UWCM]SHH79711.1 hypothetical protein SAMN05720761_12736 [Fibrobacter sp. UWCM]